MTSAQHPIPGRCPSCGAPGVLGLRCDDRVCARQGAHFIPISAAEAADAIPTAQREPLVGQYVDDFLVVGRLGRGGFGKVLEALQAPHFRMRAALKLIEFEGQDQRTSEKVLAKFETEAQALAVLQHPNIVRLLKFGRFNGRPFMAMELVPGGRTLLKEVHKLVLGHAALEPSTVQHVLAQIANGLEAAHAEGIIHRDIKPENVMLQIVVGDPWHVKLVDFGLAKFVDAGRDTSLVLGTVLYMAPEQLEGKNLGPWTDIYALGAVAFELVTGHRPFLGKDQQEIIRQKIDPHFDPLSRVAGLEVSELMAEFLRRSLARHPEDRYQSIAAWRAALTRVFRAPPIDLMMSRDLSPLFESQDVLELRQAESRLASERRKLDAEREAFEEERRNFVSEQVRFASEAGGRVALTQALGDAPPTIAPTGIETRRSNEARPRARWPFAVGVLALGAVAAGVIVGTRDDTAPAPATTPPSVRPAIAEAGDAHVPEAVDVSVAALPTAASDTGTRPQTTVAPEVIVAAPAPAAAPATLTISSPTPGAQAFLDGHYVRLGAAIETTIGARVRVTLKADGYWSATRDIEVQKPKETLRLSLTAKQVFQ